MSTSTALITEVARRVSFADPLYAEVMDFLDEEAALLDRDQQQEWLELVTEDVSYRMPVRKVVHRRDGPGIDAESVGSADWATLEMVVRRNVVIDSAYDRDPPPRFRRFV